MRPSSVPESQTPSRAACIANYVVNDLITFAIWRVSKENERCTSQHIRGGGGGGVALGYLGGEYVRYQN